MSLIRDWSASGRRWRARLLGVTVAATLCTDVVGAPAWRALDASGDPGNTVAGAVNRFFTSYVQPDGRVSRTDQGGDTVSEGQAYAMLMAVAVRDRARFDLVWNWTRNTLQQPSGTLAWHWQDGRVVDAESASDADLDAAWALALAGRVFGDPVDSGAARHVADGILSGETVQVQGLPVMVAGPWARTAPPRVDPSYFATTAFAALFDLTDQWQWHQLYLSSMGVLSNLTSSPTRLPPDWAQISSNGQPSAVGGPPGASTAGQGPSYGLDAARTELWTESDCHAAPHSISASGWSLLRPTAQSGSYPIRMSQLGQRETPYDNPLIAMADAASAAAAGNSSEATELMVDANRLNEQHPTYYGSAWVALGRILLTTDSLENCPPL